ncbi:hypothetical protein SynWH8101_0782 [Synechococcus sp. WH 8101]|nr:hypothetical protein SynWH8101_0782 [Synechococcus sp. WH 8101]
MKFLEAQRFLLSCGFRVDRDGSMPGCYWVKPGRKIAELMNDEMVLFESWHGDADDVKYKAMCLRRALSERVEEVSVTEVR